MAGAPREARHREAVVNSENQQREGARRQDNEAGKNKDVEDSRRREARMLPLPQPELQDPAQAQLRDITEDEKPQYTDSVTVKWAQEGVKWRADCATTPASYRNTSPYSENASSDGDVYRAWDSRSDTGIVRRSSEAGLPQRVISPLDFLGSQDFLSMLASERTALAGTQLMGDHECYRLEYDGGGGPALSAWLDPGRGFGIVRIEERTGTGALVRRLDVNRMTDVGGGLWVPLEGTVTDFWQLGPDAGQPMSCTIFKVDAATLRVNEAVDEGLFTLPFPDGTSVWDDITQSDYVVGEDSVSGALLQAALDGEAEKPTVPERAGSTVAAGNPPATVPSNVVRQTPASPEAGAVGHRYLSLFMIGVAVLGLGVYVWWVHQAHGKGR